MLNILIFYYLGKYKKEKAFIKYNKSIKEK